MKKEIPMTKSRILVADDDKDDFNTLKDAFELMEQEVDLIHVNDGYKLFEVLMQHNFRLPDLIVLDINMPRMDGFVTLARIKSERGISEIPVVVYSTSSDNDHITKSYHLGATAFITKPCNFKGIMDVARSLQHYSEHATDILHPLRAVN